MINREELREYAKTKKLNLGQAEKEYFQNILLFILYERCGKELVFKGGTALSKVYGLDRFSEDLDFTLRGPAEVQEILQKGLAKFLLETELQQETFGKSFSYILRIKGPLYAGSRMSLCRLELDFSLRKNIMREPMIVSLGRFLRELPPFDVVVMAKEEILAEKIRAIMSRTKARDVYDLWFLVKENTLIDHELIAEKLKYYETSFNLSAFTKHLHLKKEIWESELTPLLSSVPPFAEVQKLILKKMGTGKASGKKKYGKT